MTNKSRWLALIIVCLGYLMIVLDVTIVGVALPSIRADLGFSESSLAWVANAYLLTFGGFLLLAGRLGDLFSHRRLFLIGITVFTLASLACGLAKSQAVLIGSRALQGLGGALVSAAALSLTATLFTEWQNGRRPWASSVSSPRAADRSVYYWAEYSLARSTGIGSSSSMSRSG
jgi:MFS family permease